MSHPIKFKDLVEGEKYTLVGPLRVPGKQDTVDKLIAAPHMVLSIQHGSLRFKSNDDDINNNSNSNNENYPRMPEENYLDISKYDLPDGENQVFEAVQKSVRNVTENKAKNQALRNVYEGKANTSATPGQGPANIIRGFLGTTVPKGAQGGMRNKRSRRTRRNKNTRSTKSRRSRR